MKFSHHRYTGYLFMRWAFGGPQTTVYLISAPRINFCPHGRDIALIENAWNGKNCHNFCMRKVLPENISSVVLGAPSHTTYAFAAVPGCILGSHRAAWPVVGGCSGLKLVDLRSSVLALELDCREAWLSWVLYLYKWDPDAYMQSCWEVRMRAAKGSVFHLHTPGGGIFPILVSS